MAVLGAPLRPEASKHSEARVAQVAGALIATRQLRTSSMQLFGVEATGVASEVPDPSCTRPARHERNS
jgi:hypothetical protein